ncbi:MAG TPA: hypothetical protein VHL98_14440 [Microvirga sp.]|jgi:hypothetical protein|nr:hypothetical protein [Microvirga sp.]
MKQFLLFAGRAQSGTAGVHGLAGDFDSFADAFISLIDRQTPCDWWHILDTRTGEVVERRHLKVSNGMIGFQRSDWVVGEGGPDEPLASITLPAPAAEVKLPEIASIEADLRSVLNSGLKNGHANGKTNGAAAEH